MNWPKFMCSSAVSNCWQRIIPWAKHQVWRNPVVGWFRWFACYTVPGNDCYAIFTIDDEWNRKKYTPAIVAFIIITTDPENILTFTVCAFIFIVFITLDNSLPRALGICWFFLYSNMVRTFFHVCTQISLPFAISFRLHGNQSKNECNIHKIKKKHRQFIGSVIKYSKIKQRENKLRVHAHPNSVNIKV